MTIALVSSSAVANNTGTTTGIDTTGATLLVAAVTYFSSGTLTDSKGNTWTALTARGGFGFEQIYYCVSPTSVGTGHTISYSGGFTVLQLLAFSGVAAFDKTAGANGLTPGSITPTNANELVITLVQDHGTGNDFTSAPAGFTLTGHVSGNTSNNFATGVAYQIQTSATAANPTWTETGSGDAPGSTIAAFTATGGGGGGATTYTLSGPSSGATGSPSTNFTVQAVGTLGSGVTITPHTSGTGTFSPTSVTLAAGTNTSATFTYTPGASETATITTTNSSTLTDPSSASYTSSSATATAYTLTGPTPRMGVRGSASGNFTVTPNAPYTGTITITPSGGGISTPIVLTFSASSAPQTFTITPTAKGVVTLTPSNSGSLTNPVKLTYVCLPKVKIVFKGDSLTYGVNASSGGGTASGTTYPGVVMTQLQGANSFYSAVNLGISGEELSAMLTGEAGEIQPQFDATKEINILVIMAGTNDILHFDASAASMWANMVTYVANAQGYGFNVIIQTIPPAAYPAQLGTADFPWLHDQYTDLIRSNWKTTKAVALSDPAADSRIGWNGDETNATYFNGGDFTHLTDAGYAIVASYAAQAIQSVIDGATNVSGGPGGLLVNPGMAGGMQ
jgi:lysophospholipase L1-like esterase